MYSRWGWCSFGWRNVEKFCELLKEASNTSNNRFLVVTHNKITMGFMNKLYGITMIGAGSSKVVSVNLDEAESVYAQNNE